MNLTNSLLRDLITEYSSLRPQIYFKSSLIALARAMQDVVLADRDRRYLVIANFQKEQFFRQSEKRFQQMGTRSDHVYILGIPDIESSFAISSQKSNSAIANTRYETIPIKSTDTLAGERYLVIIGQKYSACVVVQEKLSVKELKDAFPTVEDSKRFEGIWSFDRDIVYSAADWLLGTIANYRPELKDKTQQARKLFQLRNKPNHKSLLVTQSVDLGIFTQSLVTYIQAGQYKLLKAYKKIAIAERKEQLINEIAQAQRNSLKKEEILSITVQKLGKIFPQCRCLLYSVAPNDSEITIEYESVAPRMPSLMGQKWSISDNPIFLVAQTQNSALAINNVAENAYLQENATLKDQIKEAAINSWLMVAIRYQDILLGVLELHHSGGDKFQWRSEDVSLVEAVANNAGVALTQANAYNNLVDLNEQLEAVERIQSNLIAVVGHELRTPLSTICICLESLADEPDMPGELRESMLSTALSDSDRLSHLIQDFLTLSKLETGKVYRNIESISLEYPLSLAMHRLKKKFSSQAIPQIKIELSPQLPYLLADVEGLVEVLFKLLDNACKFTSAEGKIVITAKKQNSSQEVSLNSDSQPMVEVTVADTGRGIEADLLNKIFDRFSQSENYLRRTVNGTGLGLVICRQIVNGMNGEIWAISHGIDRGSEFHFTVPMERRKFGVSDF